MSPQRTEEVSIRADLGRGAEGYLVIDTTFQNGSSGGLRVAEDLTLEEVETLAREMTLKFAFIGRASGGAKSGVRVPRNASQVEKRGFLFDFGHHLGPLLRRGIYSPGTDMNCSRDDLKALFLGAGLRLGEPTDTAFFTAMAAFDAVEACRERARAPARALRIGIEGFGAVAASLAARLPSEHYAITALSTVHGAVLNERGFAATELIEKKRRFGDAMIEHLDGCRGACASVFSADLDILMPSARTWSITAEVARTIRAPLVVPLANAPYAAQAIDVLESKGAVCLPGFVVNSGGVFASSLHDSGVPLAAVEQVSRRHFRAVVAALLDMRSGFGASPVTLAHQIALERLQGRQARAAPDSRYRRVVRTLVRDHTPRRLYGQYCLKDFRNNLIELERLIHRRGACSVSDARRTGF